MAVDSFLSFNSPLTMGSIQENLKRSGDSLARSFERLSSGLRINSPVDDPAGLSLATGAKTSERLASVAIRNLNDGISAVSIGKDALTQQQNILLKLEELAGAASSQSLSSTQRTAYVAEYQANVAEFGRIGDTAAWSAVSNDLYMLAAGRGTNPASISVQAGIASDTNSSFSIGFADTAEYSGVINRNDLVTSVGLATTDANISTLASRFSNQMMNFSVEDSTGEFRTVLGGLSVNGNTLTISLYMKHDETNAPPADPTYYDYSTAATVTYNTTTGAFNQSSLEMYVGTFESGGFGKITMDLRGLKMSSTTATSAPNLGDTSAIEMSGIETAGRASEAAAIIDQQQIRVDAAAGNFAASESRLNQAINYMAVERENFGAAYDRITSVDVAEEVSNMVAGQIRQLGGEAAYIQANQEPHMALKLLETTLDWFQEAA